MAEKKMTRAEALNVALEVLTLAEAGNDNPEYTEAIGVLVKMREQLQKPRKKSDTPSKARILNESLAAKCLDAMQGHENVTTKWLMEHVTGLLTPQKTTAVMRILLDSNKVVRNKDGKAVTYSLA